MISGFAVNQVYLAAGVTDMRKSINGLSLMVSEQLAHDPFSGSVFVFCNRARDKLKILYWECNGFWLYYRRLDKGKFQVVLPPPGQGEISVATRVEPTIHRLKRA